MKVLPILMKPSIVISLVTAASIIVCQLIFRKSSPDLTVGLSALLVVIGVLVTTIVARSEIVDFTYGVALGSSLLSNLFISILTAIYLYIHKKFVIGYTPLSTTDPNLSASDAEMQEILNLMEKPINYAVGSFAIYFIIGFIFSLVASLFLKRDGKVVSASLDDL